MPKARLSRSAIEASADPKWAVVGAVYDFLARTPYRDLSPPQRTAQLALFYDNEINNGGHLQYFHNVGVERAGELIEALDAIGAAGQRRLFERALALARANPVEQAGLARGLFRAGLRGRVPGRGRRLLCLPAGDRE